MLELRAADTTEASFVLAPGGVPLAAVRVAGRAMSEIDRSGFTERRKAGIGTFLTRADIVRLQSVRASDVLRSVPGLQVTRYGTGWTVALRRAGANCYPRWFVNGSPFQMEPGDLDAMFRPDDIEAIEVYAGASQIPAQFGGIRAGCGVIAVWTRAAAVDRRR